MRKRWVYTVCTVILAVAALAAAGAVAPDEVWSCDMRFTVEQQDADTALRQGGEAALEAGVTAVLTVRFVEDHRRCITPPEATVYLLEDRRWVLDPEQPLSLVSMGEWKNVGEGAWEQALTFIPAREGNWSLEVIRDCPRGGFDTVLEFRVD